MAGADAEQMVHHLEPFLALRVVHSANVHNTLELTLRVITKEREDWDDARRRNVERQFVLEYRELLNELGETLYEVGTVGMHGLRGCGIFGNCGIWGGLLRKGRL